MHDEIKKKQIKLSQKKRRENVRLKFFLILKSQELILEQDSQDICYKEINRSINQKSFH